MTRSPAVLAVLSGLVLACAAERDAGVPADTTASAPDSAAVQPDGARAAWPQAGPVNYRREHNVDLTGDGRAESVVASAHGPAYDSLDVAITIEGPEGDTLWHEGWTSLHYFKYDGLEGKQDTTVMRIVRDHVEQLLARDRFELQGGLPALLRRGGNPDAIMSEAIHYHLAELEWRRNAGLGPAVPTPPDAYSSISTDDVAPERVGAVLAEVRTRPSYMYHAGGEATYAIAWSDSENAFVRIHSCC